MEEFLLSKLSKISEEEERILTGDGIDKGLYTADGDFIVDTEKIMTGGREIAIRTHTRFTPFPIHKHNYLEMMIVLTGSITHRIGGEKITLREGDILVLNKHVSHSIDKAGAPDIGVNVIMSDNFVEALAEGLSETVFSELVRQNEKQGGSGIYLSFGAKGNKQISNIIENLLFELTEYSADAEILKYTTTLLFNYLSRKSNKLLKLASRLPDKNGMRKAEILSYVRSNYRTATLTELADKMFLSAPYLSKTISALFGKSFKELLVEERIRRASELITKTDLPISDIIAGVGYENESYFYREFKARMGKTPLYARKEKELAGKD